MSILSAFDFIEDIPVIGDIDRALSGATDDFGDWITGASDSSSSSTSSSYSSDYDEEIIIRRPSSTRRPKRVIIIEEIEEPEVVIRRKKREMNPREYLELKKRLRRS